MKIPLGTVTIPYSDLMEISSEDIKTIAEVVFEKDMIDLSLRYGARFRLPAGHPGITISRPTVGDEEDTLP